MTIYTGTSAFSTYALESTGVASVTYSHDQSLIYVARRDGHIDVFDRSTHGLVTSWTIGTALGGMSLSEDGTFLLVTEEPLKTPLSPVSSGSPVVHRVSTVDGSVQNYTDSAIPAGSFHDVEIVDAHTAILSGPQMVKLDLDTGAFTPLLGATYLSSAQSVLVEDQHLTLIAEPGNSNSPLFIYDDRTGTITASSTSSGINWGHQAISEAAGQVAQFHYDDKTINLYDLSLHRIGSVSIGQEIDGLAYDPTGTYFYAYLINSGVLAKYSVATFTLVDQISVGTAHWHNHIGSSDQIHVSDDGNTITLSDTDSPWYWATNGKLQLIDLTARNEFFAGTSGADTFLGRDGNDTYVVNNVGDIVIETAANGTDTVQTALPSYTLPANVENLTFIGTGAFDGTGNTLDNIITASGATGMVHLFGDAGKDTLYGGSGNDVLTGGAGGDTLYGGNGDDVLFSQDRDPNAYAFFSYRGISTDFGTEVDTLNGGGGDDFIYAGYGDNVDGGAQGTYGNRLFISFQGATSGVTADFRLLNTQASITIGGGVITNIQGISYLEGSQYDDLLAPIDTGYTIGANVYGRGGNDHIIGNYYSGIAVTGLYGGDGDDLIDASASEYGPGLYGDAGNDTLIGGRGYETMHGGTGDDIIDGNYGYDILWGDEGSDTIDGGSFRDNIFGGDGNDTLYGAGDADNVYGGEGNDTLYGDYSLISSANELGGSLNDDYLFGGNGADVLHGDLGNDVIWSGNATSDQSTIGVRDGGTEHDQLYGDAGDDQLSIGYGDDADGGTGTDTLNISLTGATSGVAFDAMSIISGGTVTFAGGTLQNIERIGEIFGSAFDDQISVGTQATGATLYGNAGNDSLIGGAGNDRLDGGIGNDQLDGKDGDDTLIGGNGDDTYVIDSLGDVVVENANDGNDTIVTSLDNYVLGATGDVENLTLTGSAVTGSGNGLDNVLTGNALANTLYGDAGNDRIDGGGGADTLIGGLGDDLYVITDASTVIVENAGEGSDTIKSSVSYVLGAGVEVETLRLMGTANLDLTGNTGSQSLGGNSGNNLIDGGGGGDNMKGGAGNDTYIVRSAGDHIVEIAGEGDDTVRAALSFTLGAAVQVEHLATIDAAATTAINLTGNAYSHDIEGNAGINVLTGGSGADTIIGNGGADTLIGGLGDDYYVVTDASTVIVELAGEGNDTIRSSVSYVLGAGVSVEQVRLMGAASVDLTGNADFQTLAGNSGNNVLDSGGGGDRMKGAGGDDTYIVRGAADSIVEVTGDGNDTVKTAVSFTLGAAAQVEHLVTLDASATTAIDLTGNAYSHDIQGNAGANVLTGGSADDVLQGFGGNDMLTGGGGADRFVFDHSTGQDVVGDFSSGVDKLDLSAFGFASFQDVQNASHDDGGGDLVIDLDNGDTVTLMGVTTSQLQSGDVILSGLDHAGLASSPAFEHIF
ncbi:MAG: calcium-binding protein [Sphingomonas sp.]